MIGERILDRYLVEQRLGGGSMGDVYKARDERLRCDVALKFLPAPSRFDHKARARFLREARALARFDHPNVCGVRDFADYQGADVLVMELVDGVTLDRRLRDRPLTEPEVVRLGIQLAEGLGAAHRAGVLHRDLKPANLAITDEGRLKILDFGLAKMTPSPGGASATLSVSDIHEVKGTLPYMAPEVLTGVKPDARSDLYSAGCVLYEMATGRRSFLDERMLELWDAILNQEPTPPRRLQPGLSPRLERTILRCLAKEPNHRYQTMEELALALQVREGWKMPAMVRRLLGSVRPPGRTS